MTEMSSKNSTEKPLKMDHLDDHDDDAPIGSGFWNRIGPGVGVVLVAFAAGALLYWRYPAQLGAGLGATVPADFAVYLKAWQRLLQGENPYLFENAASVFKYSPGFLALIGFLPKDTNDAWFYFSSLSIVLFVVALLIGARFRRWKHVVLLVIGILLSWKGIVDCLEYGQVDLFLLCLIIGMTALFTRYTVISGIIMGILPWLKFPMLFLLIPFTLAASRKQSSADPKPPLRRLKLFYTGFIFSTVFWGVAAPAIAFGPDQALALTQKWYSLLMTQPEHFFAAEFNQSLWVAVERWIQALDPMAALGISGTLGGWLLALLLIRRPISPTAQDSFIWVTPWLIIAQLLNPFAWKWGSVYLVGAGLAAFRRGRRWWALRGVLWLAVLACFILQQNFFVREFMGYQNWSDIQQLSVVTLYWVFLLFLTV